MDKSLYELVFGYLDNLSFFYGIDIDMTEDIAENIIDLDESIKDYLKEVLKHVQ